MSYTDAATPAPATEPAPEATAQTSGSKTAASVALGLGIAAFLTGWIPFVGVALGIAAACLAVVALAARQPKGLAVTGLILGIVGFVASALLSVGAVALVTMEDDARIQVLEGFGLAQPEPEPVASADDEVVGPAASAEPSTSAEPAEFTALDDAGLAAVVADPVAAYGKQSVVYGELQYVDQATEECSALVLVDDAQQASWEGYEVPVWVYPSAAVDCAALAALGEYAHVALSVTWYGSVTTEWEDGTVEDVLGAEVAHVETLTPLP